MAFKVTKRGTGITEDYDISATDDEGLESEPSLLTKASRIASSATEFLDSTDLTSPYPEDSKEDFAQRMLWACTQIIWAFEAQDFEVCAEFAYRLGHLEASYDLKEGWEEHALIGEKHRRDQSGKGKLGALARWGNHEELNLAINQLAKKTDEWGYTPEVKYLWSAFFALLDSNRLGPKDSSGSEILDTDKISWDGNEKGMTFKTFRNRIGEARKKLKDLPAR
jgi:hypothetical protein